MLAPPRLRLWGLIRLGWAGGLADAVVELELPAVGVVGSELVAVGRVVDWAPAPPGKGPELGLAPPMGGALSRLQSKGLVLKRVTWAALAMEARTSTYQPFHGVFAGM